MRKRKSVARIRGLFYKKNHRAKKDEVSGHDFLFPEQSAALEEEVSLGEFYFEERDGWFYCMKRGSLEDIECYNNGNEVEVRTHMFDVHGIVS